MAAKLLEPLLKQLSPLLRREGFKRDPARAERVIVTFSRRRSDDVERVGFDLTSSRNAKGEVAFAVRLGIEFADLERERFWIGMPDTHASDTLRSFVRKAPARHVCTTGTDWKLLAAQLAAWIATGCRAMETRKGKLRAGYVSLVEARARNARSRLAFFAGKAPAKRSKRSTGPNVFGLALQFLRAKVDRFLELEVHEFRDDLEAHDNGLQERVEKTFIDRVLAIQKELEQAPGLPSLMGTGEDSRVPLNGVLQLAGWRLGAKLLYVAASHEDRELPFVLVLGTTTIGSPG